ncbi:uncharacterized protein TM35_000031170 [Trypanosoma theileri]|uniref:PIH1 N-terminal domain-containing protein n=1 Tax=Trypanosoma theileri TaxID=67003 RepID=A0A1X0P5Z2_9TRYP|nr:uncharacterized protein TM35_000031170 [Trypanosoma theileri]ORC92364.1 hypothetical protein TM35_000031170 [Trypanosoma theileri]
MPSAPGVEAGFCFESLAEDKETLVVVNVCGHSSVGMALAKNMEPIPETYLDEYGLDNLIVPISVGPPEKYEGKKYNFVIDVVIHPSLTQRCVQSHHLFEHFVTRLTALAIDWILQECGMRLNVRCSRLLPDRKYFENTNRNIERIFSEIAENVEKEMKKEGVQEKKDNEGSFLPTELKLDDSKNVAKTRRTPLVTEMPKGSGIRKGFLNDARLYGSKGSSECNLPPPDPLQHFPEKLRNRCQVIDTRQLNSVTTTTEKRTSDSTIKALENKESEIKLTDVKEKHNQWTVQSVTCTEKEIVVRLYPPPGVASIKDVDLTVSSDTIEVDGTLVQLPKTIVIDDVSARFLKSSRTMIVNCPLA